MEFPRFYPLLDTAVLDARGFSVVEAAETLLETGVKVLQMRHKKAFSRAIFDVFDTVSRLCGEAGARFIVNDRADISFILNAGVHVGQDDLPPASVRKLLGEKGLIGFSTHNSAQFRAALAEPVDYLAFGPVFSTTSKQNPDPVTGLAELQQIQSLRDHRPLIAIGGITRGNARQVLAAGADSLAVIGDLYPNPLIRKVLRERAEEWLAVLHE